MELMSDSVFVGTALFFAAVLALRWSVASVGVSKAEPGPVLGKKGEREVKKKEKMKEMFEKGAPVTALGKFQKDLPPPGNFPTTRWLTTDLGAAVSDKYKLSEEEWEMKLSCGEVTKAIRLKDIESLPGFGPIEGVTWNCVTGWTKTELAFQGVPVENFLGLVDETLLDGKKASSSWRYALQHCADGYTAPIFREDLVNTGSYFATREGNGNLMSMEHGGPRLVVPTLWGWKSGKWLESLRLSDSYEPGFWENLICHERGRVYDISTGNYVEERWAKGLGLVSDVLSSLANLWHKVFGPGAYEFVMYWGGKAVGKLGSPLMKRKED